MAIIQWQEAFDTNIKPIDEQHKKLVQILNDVDASKTQESKTIIRALEKLFEYIDYHFSFEEALMKKANFSGYARHKGLHDEMTKIVQEYRENIHTEKAIDAHKLISFLVDWLIVHIMQEDKSFALESPTVAAR
jgi:hemerythrin